MTKSNPKRPITNAHSHVFTHKYVPPFLAKTIVPWPFYYIIHVPTFVQIYITYNRLKELRFRPTYRLWKRRVLEFKRTIHQNGILSIVYKLILIWMGITAFFILFHFVASIVNPSGSKTVDLLLLIEEKLTDYYVLYQRPEWLPYWLTLVYAFWVVLFIRSARKFIVFIMNNVWRFLHLLPGKKTKELLGRYLMMARFALYEGQGGVMSRLKQQYPVGTHFVLLPMDMEFMGAGKLKRKWNYENQMQELARIASKKDDIHPFIFIDPRRIRAERKRFFDYEFENGKVTLKQSLIKEYLDYFGFKGFKIYPALGYFPFDEDLLPLWKYAADNGIPIMTHGVKGVIYYRGKLKKEWNEHSVFTEFLGRQERRPLYFSQFKNEDFQVNFTHPMNYLCLLEEPLLRILIGKGTDENKALFGYTHAETPLKYDLSQLKICFAHFGGAEEWNKFLERDREVYAQHILTKPETGIVFKTSENEEIPWGRYEHVWKSTDWYSICTSMMIQYENFYTDISYIVSKPELFPVLRSTICEPGTLENHFTAKLTYESRSKLRKRVLFGSDFYVVRSQMADKDIFIELKAYLTEDEFDLIARDNPYEYLKHTD